jgi:cardiolipin synthase
VLLDSTGSPGFPPEYGRALTDAGCRPAWFRPLKPWQLDRFKHRMHRRILVVDWRVGITGGSGINDKWQGDGLAEGHWRDTNARVAGPIVEYLQAAFAQNRREATGIVLRGTPTFPGSHPSVKRRLRSSPARRPAAATKRTSCSCSPSKPRARRSTSRTRTSCPTSG